MINASKREPAPNHDGKSVTNMVKADLDARREEGIKTYGGELTTHNGRNALMDAYQEALDLACYLRQLLEEQRDD